MKAIRGAVLLAAVVAAGSVFADDGVVGEVVDQACFLRNEARGDDHQECAARCLKNGNAAGILTDDGELYTLAASASGYESLAFGFFARRRPGCLHKSQPLDAGPRGDL